MTTLAKAAVNSSYRIMALFLIIIGGVASIFISVILPWLAVILILFLSLAVIFAFFSYLSVTEDELSIRVGKIRIKSVPMEEIVTLNEFNYKNCLYRNEPIRFFDFEAQLKCGRTEKFPTSWCEGTDVVEVLDAVMNQIHGEKEDSTPLVTNPSEYT
jgi:hypothetical protein